MASHEGTDQATPEDTGQVQHSGATSSDAEVKSKILQRISEEIASRTAEDGFETLADPYYKSGGNPYYYKR
jgi:hypothetical protein